MAISSDTTTAAFAESTGSAEITGSAESTGSSLCRIPKIEENYS
jgi:hypothetical protein